jgi:hypothetical protein
LPQLPQLSNFSITKIPPQVDTSVASESCPFQTRPTIVCGGCQGPKEANSYALLDRAYGGQGQLTPVSMSSGSRSLSPKTPEAPSVRAAWGGRAEDPYAPKIAGEFESSPRTARRPGGYGGFSAEPESFESADAAYAPSSPKGYGGGGGGLLDRMNNATSGPFDMPATRRPAVAPRNAFPARNNTTAGPTAVGLHPSSNSRYAKDGRPGTSPGLAPSGAESSSRSLPRQNGYGGFGAEGEGFEPPPFGASKRSETFPRPERSGLGVDAPVRRPSAPGMRTNRMRRPSDADVGRAPPARGSPDQSRHRTGSRGGQDRAVDLAREFGQGNPFHSPSVSDSSNTSSASQSTRPTQPSSRSSPAKAPAGSRFDDLLSDLQISMDEAGSTKALPTVPPPMAPPRSAAGDGRAMPVSRSERGSPDYSRPAPFGSSPTEAQRERRYDPAVQSARGDCKACGRSIVGKSISSADGRLTGRYHKACFVCTQCQAPFASSTFYVLDNAPYCELHYHELNGSLCTSCGIGIEGQYLEDESAKKHHLGCFRCGDCSKVLQDGYFEVNGQAFCESDAWRRVQQQQQQPQQKQQPYLPMDSARSRPTGQSRLGLPVGPGSRVAAGGKGLGLPTNNRPGQRPRLEKRMTRIGMM